MHFETGPVYNIRLRDHATSTSEVRVKVFRSDTFSWSVLDFHENWWDLVKNALFTPKSPFGRQRPQKHLKYIGFCNTLSEVRRRVLFFSFLQIPLKYVILVEMAEF